MKLLAMRSAMVLLIFFLTGAAIGGERGSPPTQVYDVQELGGAHVNHKLAQLPDGRLVVVNNVGLMQFDGARWQIVRHPRGLGDMMHLSLGPEGRIYTSFDGDIGYFQHDATGQAIWYSELDRFPVAQDELGEIIDVSHDRQRAGLWVTAFTAVWFLPDDGRPALRLSTEQTNIFASLANGEYLLQQLPDYVLSRVLMDERATAGLALELVPGANHLRSEQLWAVAEGSDDSKLVTASGLLTTYKDGRLQPWSEALVPLLRQAGVRTLLRLSDGRHVLGSQIGLSVVDSAGQLIDQFDQSDGLPGQRRNHGLIEDRDGDLWVAQDRTITRLSLARGVTVYDEARGLPSATDARRWRGQLYASSVTGLFRLEAAPADLGGGRFVQILPELIQVRSIAVIDDDHLLVAYGGVHDIQVDAEGQLRSELAVKLVQTSVLERSRWQPRRAFAAHATGVMQIDFNTQGQFAASPVPLLDSAYHRLAKQDADTLWLADRVDGVVRADRLGRWPPRRYGVADGLPEGQVRIYGGHHRVWFTTNLGLRVHDPASDRFVIPAGLPAELAQDRLFAVHEDTDGNLWVRGGAIENDLYWKTADGWRADGSILRVVDPYPTIFNFLREGDVVWAIRANGLLRMDLAARRELPNPPLPLLSSAYDLRARSALALDQLDSAQLNTRDIRFDFALPSLHRPYANTYRSRLLGYDDWSDWGGLEAASRVYTNIPDGAFTVEVEARDSFSRLTGIAQQSLLVPAPWWRSGQAQGAYVGLAVLLLWSAAMFGARRRQRLMLARQRELESTVAQRTAELAMQNLQLADQAVQLKLADELKTRFFVNVGHEFRTPLTLVMGPLEDVLNDPRTRLGERTREQLELANRNARRVLDLIVELLDVNRIEHGQLPLKRVDSDLERLLHRLIDDSRALVERYGHRIEFEILASPPPVYIDTIQFERVLANLIGNAAKFTPRGGAITVSLSCDAAMASIEVRDQGRGIPSAALPHVFDRFYRGEGDADTVGFGVGLALSREIVERHDGQISVRSEQGLGSCFRIELPIAGSAAQALNTDPSAPLGDHDAAPENAAAHLAAASSGSTGRELPLVLVVDDHPDLRLRLRQLLESRYRVIEANDGPSALALAHAELPDIIVSDVMMPGFDGVELTRRLRSSGDSAAIPILLLTARSGSDHAVVGLQAGANDYLSKPFDSSELLARIGALLAQGRRLQLKLAREPRLTLPLPKKAQEEDRWRHKLDRLIEQHLADSSFGVDQLAAAMHLDRSALFRRFKSLSGQSPGDHLRERRMQRAHELLESGAGNVTEVAYSVGFESLSSFSRAFRLHYQCAPSEVVPGNIRAAPDEASGTAATSGLRGQRGPNP